MSWFVLSHNPVLTTRNSKCLNVHIVNDGRRLFVFNDVMTAKYLRTKFAPDIHVVTIEDPQVLLNYCEESKIAGVKVIHKVFCDMEQQKELCEYEDLNGFDILQIPQ